MLTMDNKSMELLQQGKYLKALKNYVEVAADESIQTNQFSGQLPPGESLNQPGQRLQSGGQKVAHQAQQHQPQRSSQKRGSQSMQQMKSMGPTRPRISKESIIKIDHNSSAGAVGSAILLIVVLSIIFFATL